MSKIKWAAVLVVFCLCIGAAAVLLAAPAYAAGTRCWQVQCNTCCKTGGGPVICTQRACV